MSGRIPIRLMPLKNNDMNPNLGPLKRKAAIIICFFCYGPGINPYPAIGAIPLPPGYHRIAAADGSFAAWLRRLPLKSDRTVRLYDGSPKLNQDAQFAVLDVSVGHTDLQQCADAVMRLRAEYLYSLREFKAIEFCTSQGVRLNFQEWAQGKRWRRTGDRLIAYRTSDNVRGQDGGRNGYCDDRACFMEYLRTVFSYCGTLTLEKELIPVARTGEMRIGDVLIRGGSPGHAMLVVDMA
jgi:hypothetical protein